MHPPNPSGALGVPRGTTGRPPVRLVLPLLLAVAVVVAGVTLPVAGAAAQVASPTPAGLAAAAVLTGTVEDSTQGTGTGQVSYAGDWIACGGCVPATPNGRFTYTLQSGATATIRFTGTRIDLYGIFESHGGIASVRVDDMPAVDIDTYAPTSRVGLWHRYEGLASGNHVAVIANTHRHNPASDEYVVGFDRAEVYSEPVVPNRSGLAWRSGVNGDPLINPSSVDTFCSWRGRRCDLAHVYTARNSWDAVVRPSFAELNFAGWPGRLVISVPPFPENVGASYAACASGAYDAQWRTFGNTLNSTGRQDSIVRVAWEANGNWFPWSGTNPNLYVSCWRRIANAINATASPDPMLDWTINAHYSQNPPSHNPLDLYPGDQWVDVVGIDAYDHYPPSRTKAAFDAQANAQGGITWLYNFARSHGKLFGVGEWGVATGSGADGGGDNPNYIQYMNEWFTARSSQGLNYEAYFNNCEPGNVGSNLYRPPGPGCLYRNTAAGGRYQQLW